MYIDPSTSPSSPFRGADGRPCRRRALTAGPLALALAFATGVHAREAATAQAPAVAPQDASAVDEAAFFARNATVPGVVTTASGLQYQVLVDGKGRRPRSTDTVKVVYTGTLLDGTVFARVLDRKQPLSFEAGSVIAGWAEALRLMHVHSRYKLWIPSKLAYGHEGIPGTIPPDSALVFDLELLDAF